MNSPDSRSMRASGNNFDFIRLACASIVILSHSYILLGAKVDPFLQLTGERAGTLAVRAFFVISGFLVFGSLSSGRSITFYAASRCLRIFPALICLCVVTALLLGLTITALSARDYLSDSGTWRYLLNSLVFPNECCLAGVFASNPVPHVVNGSLWTLSVEVLCYIGLGLLWIAGVRGPRAVGGLLVVMGSIYAVAVIHGIDWNYPMSVAGIQIFGLLCNLLYFSIGIALYVIRDRLPISSLLAFACMLGIVFGGPIGHVIAVPYLVFYVAFTKIPLHKLTEKVGDISYGVYIYGFPVQQFLVFAIGERFTPSTLTATALLISYVLGFASWRLIEKPALSLKERFL